MAIQHKPLEPYEILSEINPELAKRRLAMAEANVRYHKARAEQAAKAVVALFSRVEK